MSFDQIKTSRMFVWMKHVSYRGSFQTHIPTEQPPTVGLMARDDSTYMRWF